MALAVTVACDTKTPTAPAPPSAPGTTVLVGTVLHTVTRAPIGGAVVTVQGQVSPAPRSVVTNPDGTFRMDAVLIGVGSLRVEADGFQTYTQELTVTGVEVRTELALVPTAPPPPPEPPVTTLMRGQVTNRLTNVPVGGVTVAITLATGERFTAMTTSDGQFILTDVVVGATADVRADATGYWPYEQRLVVEMNQILTIRLDRMPSARN